MNSTNLTSRCEIRAIRGRRPEQACAVPAALRQTHCRDAGTAQACSGLRAPGIWERSFRLHQQFPSIWEAQKKAPGD